MESRLVGLVAWFVIEPFEPQTATLVVVSGGLGGGRSVVGEWSAGRASRPVLWEHCAHARNCMAEAPDTGPPTPSTLSCSGAWQRVLPLRVQRQCMQCSSPKRLSIYSALVVVFCTPGKDRRNVHFFDVSHAHNAHSRAHLKEGGEQLREAAAHDGRDALARHARLGA